MIYQQRTGKSLFYFLLKMKAGSKALLLSDQARVYDLQVLKVIKYLYINIDVARSALSDDIGGYWEIRIPVFHGSWTSCFTHVPLFFAIFYQNCILH